MSDRVTDALLIALGLAIVWIVLQDLFVSVVVPRPAPGRFRPSSFVLRSTWFGWRELVSRWVALDKREGLLGAYAPFAVLMLLVVWVAGLVLGFGLVLFALRTQVRPPPPDLGTALYLSAVSLLTIGFGDYVPVSGVARVLVVIEAGSGLGIVAMTISLLFSLYANFQKREVQVITLDSIAGAPPSGVLMLDHARRYELLDHLDDLFDQWQMWAAEVLESHLAYPVLNYFRSSHDNESWVSALGAVLDAAVLIMTSVRGGPKGHARLFYDVGTHLVEDLSNLLHFSDEAEVGVERFEWDQARASLQAAGWELTMPADAAWEAFVKLRSRYAMELNQMARHWAIPPSRWIGDRSRVRHGRVLKPAVVRPLGESAAVPVTEAPAAPTQPR